MYHFTHSALSIRIAWTALAFLAAFTFTQPVQADTALRFDSSWTFNVHNEYPGSSGSLTIAPDGSYLKLSYDFTKGGSFVSADEPLDGTDTYAGLEIRTRDPGAFSATVTDSTDQVFVYLLGSSDDGERTLTINFATDKPWLVHSGAGDKKMHFPLKTVSLLASKSDAHLSGDIEVTEVALKAAPPAVTPTP